jgi:hypothetical protein
MFKGFKPPKIKLSSTFFARTLCKFCQKPGTIYYSYKNPKLYKSPELAFRHQRVYIVNPEPAYIYMIEHHEFSFEELHFPVNISSFNIKMHRCKKISNSSNYEEALFCDCGKSCWVFNYKSVKNRKEISMRKSKKVFDSSFIY